MPASPWCPLEALIVVLYREDALEDSPGVRMVMGCQGHMGWGVGGEQEVTLGRLAETKAKLALHFC